MLLVDETLVLAGCSGQQAYAYFLVYSETRREISNWRTESLTSFQDMFFFFDPHNVTPTNRFKHVRAAVYYGGSLDIIKFSREHNDANVLSLGARFLDDRTIYTAVSQWLETPFSEEERHLRRIKKIDELAG